MTNLKAVRGRTSQTLTAAVQPISKRLLTFGAIHEDIQGKTVTERFRHSEEEEPGWQRGDVQ